MLARVADPRHRRGVRHLLAVILGLALCAVVAGAWSFTAIAEWAADADEHALRVLGVSDAVPSESTFRRTLQPAGQPPHHLFIAIPEYRPGHHEIHDDMSRKEA